MKNYFIILFCLMSVFGYTQVKPQQLDDVESDTPGVTIMSNNAGNYEEVIKDTSYCIGDDLHVDFVRERDGVFIYKEIFTNGCSVSCDSVVACIDLEFNNLLGDSIVQVVINGTPIDTFQVDFFKDDLSPNYDTGILSHTNTKGETSGIDICRFVDSCETLTSLNIEQVTFTGDSLAYEYTYIDEDGQANIDTFFVPKFNFTVNSGSTPAVSDAVNGTAEIGDRDSLHFWSSDTSVQINVMEGSAIVDLKANVLDTVYNRIVKQVEEPFCDSISLDSFVFIDNSWFVKADTLDPCEYRPQIEYISNSGSGKDYGFEHLPNSTDVFLNPYSPRAQNETLYLGFEDFTINNISKSSPPNIFHLDGNLKFIGQHLFDTRNAETLDNDFHFYFNEVNIRDNTKKIFHSPELAIDAEKQLYVSGKTVGAERYTYPLFNQSNILSMNIESYNAELLATGNYNTNPDRSEISHIHIGRLYAKSNTLGNQFPFFEQVGKSSYNDMLDAVHSYDIDAVKIEEASLFSTVELASPNANYFYDLGYVNHERKSAKFGDVPLNDNISTHIGVENNAIIKLGGRLGDNDNSDFTIANERLVSDIPILVEVTNNNTTFNVNIESSEFESRCLEVLGVESGSVQTVYVRFGHVISNSSCAIKIEAPDGLDIVIYDSIIETKGVGFPVIYSNSDIRIKNTILINDGLAAPIQAPSIIDVSCMNVFSNSLVIDPNVTELVENIKRSPNVR